MQIKLTEVCPVIVLDPTISHDMTIRIPTIVAAARYDSKKFFILYTFVLLQYININIELAMDAMPNTKRNVFWTELR
jgi:hypothetical protein